MKSVKAKYQFQVMLTLGIPREELHKFADANYWLHYFPQLWQQHLTGFDCGIDWRRTFITTDVNGYYDSFVRWQMRRLRDLGKTRFGKRYTIYSPKNGQPCLDHDWASGQGVLVQEYIALKFPATLRPESMYGQTDLFVSSNITYGIFKVSEKAFYLVTDRAARNMAFPVPEVTKAKGSALLSTQVQGPRSVKGEIHIIPMDTIKEAKSTGLVTPVPSDSPDNYIMTAKLSRKATFYNLKPEWAGTV
ncbi:cytosolic leucyl tRNA synthetase [Collariella sp. IMI 366227]|nr:cytosolic leucyl tRNA synthetase [Collariella sp. IMI 366227]